MTRSILLAALVACLLASVALARYGVVTTHDGQTFEGQVEEKINLVMVTSRGIQTRLDPADIASIEYVADFEKDFAERLAKLDPDDVEGRIALARQAFANRRYVLARDALEQALTIDPNNAEAVSLLNTVQAQIRLERERRAPAPVDPEARPNDVAPLPPRTFLSPDDINRIRQEELRRTDVGVRIRFERGVQRRFVSYRKYIPGEFFALAPVDQAWLILTEGLPEMQRDVRIVNDPPALLQYRRVVQPFVLQNCATSACHGGMSASELVLFNPADSDAATYTNFYILNQFVRPRPDPGTVFTGGDLRMINRVQPARSLLLNYALPPQIAEFDHPPVTGYRPGMRGFDDIRYRQIHDWIANWLQPVPPDYGIEYTPPAGKRRVEEPPPEPAQ